MRERASCWSAVNLELGLATKPGVAGTVGLTVTAAGVAGREVAAGCPPTGRRRGNGTFPGVVDVAAGATPAGVPGAAFWAAAAKGAVATVTAASSTLRIRRRIRTPGTPALPERGRIP